jgi:hypothetical protein
MPNNMPDAPFMISPAGVLVDPNFNATPQPGLGPNIDRGNPMAVAQLLPGAAIQLRGIGQFDLSGENRGISGTLQADIITATAAPASVIAALVGSVGGVTKYLVIALDTSNRPRVLFTNDAGTLVGRTQGAGAAVVAGTPFQLRLAWNSGADVLAGRFGSFRINGVLVPNADWNIDPIAAWTPFYPVAVLVGTGGVGGFAGLTDTTAKINHVQVSNTITA